MPNITPNHVKIFPDTENYQYFINTCKKTTYNVNNKDYDILENNIHKMCIGEDYNFYFNKNTGFFVRWGVTLEDDPIVAPAPELLDIEISSGKCIGNCSYCYKCNNMSDNIKYMTFETFKLIFDKLPRSITQIAFGITDVYANPDFFKIMRYTKDNGIIPNYTTHGLDLDDKAIRLTSELCGAIAVSLVHKETSYNAIKKLTDKGMKQVNCHYMLSEETYDKLFDFLKDIKTDDRLSKLNAVVLLQYKDKNPNAKYHSLLDIEKYQKIIKYCTDNSINYGFDSCSAGLFVKSIENDPNRKELEQCVDSCESTCQSFYINTDGIMYPCSFCENMNEWTTGINTLEINDFIKDVWFNDKVNNWRNNLLKTTKNNCRFCPIYNLNI